MKQKPTSFLYLSRSDVASVPIATDELVYEVGRCLAEVAEGERIQFPPHIMPVSETSRFVAKSGLIRNPSIFGIKWLGYFPGNSEIKFPDFHPMMMLNEAEHGMPVAVLDGTWISEIRTAAISAFAAKHLALPTSSSLGFIACGAQASAHLNILKDLFCIKKIFAYSRKFATASEFCRKAEAMGLTTEICESPQAVLEQASIIITSVPHASETNLQLRGDAVASGTFISMVDRGYSWNAGSLLSLDAVITDDMALSGPRGMEAINFETKHLSGDLIAVARGELIRRADSDRVALIFSGPGIIDTAIASLIFQRASEMNIGVNLPL